MGGLTGIRSLDKLVELRHPRKFRLLCSLFMLFGQFSMFHVLERASRYTWNPRIFLWLFGSYSLWPWLCFDGGFIEGKSGVSKRPLGFSRAWNFGETRALLHAGTNGASRLPTKNSMGLANHCQRQRVPKLSAQQTVLALWLLTLSAGKTSTNRITWKGMCGQHIHLLRAVLQGLSETPHFS